MTLHGIAWYDNPTVVGVYPYVRNGDIMIPNVKYIHAQEKMKSDPVNHPSHYCSHPSGIECIEITEWMSFNVGNAFKYLYRCTDKGYTLNDVKKAQWYLKREIARREEFYFRWFSESEKYDATFDGSAGVQRILSFESRFNGWMKQALERIYTASVQKRGTLALETALSAVGSIIQIQEYREGKLT